jgi:hypothetical protein
LLRRTPKYGPPARLHRVVAHVLVVFSRVSVARHIRIGIATRAVDGRAIGFAQPRRRLGQRIQDDLQIEGRAADDLKHVGGGGLLLQRFAQLVKEPGVLDGNDGLRGEVLQQLDLLIGDGPPGGRLRCRRPSCS